jgi:hypothetical protein
MADQMRPTPRNSVLGLFSDIVNLPLQYMSSPERTQQMQGTAEFLYGTGIPKTLERMSYGDSLFSGSGMTLRPKEETINATMNVAPFAPAVGRLASRAIKATEGMPVGMSIKDVSPKIGINVNQGGSSFADKIISGEKKFETRESDSLRSYVGKRVGIIRTGEGKAKAIGDVTLGEPIVVSSPEEFAKLRDLHLVPEGSKFDIKEGGVKYLYPIENPVPYGVEKDVAKYGIVSRKILGEPDTLEKAIYPQQAALDLAQQRAALPVEQGGLGLPVNNTAADRAAAMGFDVEAYHGTASKDIQKFMPEGGTPEGEKTLEWYKNRQAQNEPVGYMAFRGGSFFSPKADYAGSYAPEGTGVMYPVNLRMENPLSLLPNAQGRYSATNAPDINKTIDAMILQDSLNKSINEIAIIDPAQIRSRFAAYDPFRRNVATATAMGVALPDLLAQPVNQYQNPYETLPMYTDPFGNTIGSSIR